MFYSCPLCRQPLILQQRTWRCDKGHCFDMAKEGYVNLLPVQNKKSQDPGDNKQMMFARREFLNKGYYEHLSDRVNQLALEYTPLSESILDIGCGEGYYTGRLTAAFKQSENAQTEELKVQGLDISKSAIRYGAKRYKELEFCVASVFDMPFVDDSFDLMIRIYAPSDLDEIKRVLKPGGILITVAPGPWHHYALKKTIYSDPKPHPESEAQLTGLTCLHQERLTSEMYIEDQEDLTHFLEMTPYAWKLSNFQKEQLASKGLKCELDFQIEIHKLN